MTAWAGARAREAVAESALALFLEKGFQGATLDAIARDAGVHRSTAHESWRGKPGLFIECARRARERDLPGDWSMERVLADVLGPEASEAAVAMLEQDRAKGPGRMR